MYGYVFGHDSELLLLILKFKNKSEIDVLFISMLTSFLTRFLLFGDRAFENAAPRLWNKLPSDLKSATSFQTFKEQLKTHLFKLEYCSA